MIKSSFENIVIIGYGKVTGSVIEIVYNFKKKYGYFLSYIEHEIYSFNKAKSFCEEKKIASYTITDKDELKHYFLNLKDNTLIISASNNYIFPEEVINKNNISIINFHNALLPNYPGRNAPSWVIYMQEKVTGITWHYVSKDVDAGNIIIQKECQIGDDIKAYELADMLMQIASDAFEEIFENLVLENISITEQNRTENIKMYKSRELPGECRFDINDKTDEIYRLLRAVDYGKNNIFPLVTTIVDGKEVKIVRYKKIKKSEIKVKENTLVLDLDEEYSLQLKYSM